MADPVSPSLDHVGVSGNGNLYREPEATIVSICSALF
jgi:hypothetical protein